MLYLRTLGKLALYEGRGDRVPLLQSVKPLLIPAVLATRPGHEATRAHLANLIWPAADADRARASLRQALRHLVRYARGGGVETLDGRVRLDPAAVGVDVWAFDGAIREGRWADAVSLYRGSFVSGAERHARSEMRHWIDAQDVRVSAGVRHAYRELVQACLRDGAMQEAVRHAQAYARMDPLSETAQLTLVNTFRSVGDDLEALRAVEAYRSLVLRELQEELSEEARASLERVRHAALREPDAVRVVYVGRPGEYNRTSRDRVAWAALGVALTVAALSALQGGGAPAGAQPQPVTVGVELTDGTLADADIIGDELQVRPRPFRNDPARHELIDPGRRRRVFTVPGETGRDLILEELATGQRLMLASEPGDKAPLIWSPDGRQLLYRRGHPDPSGSAYEAVPVAVNIATGARRVLGDVVFPTENFSAVWSPSGLRVAVAYRAPDSLRALYVMDVDGSNLARVALPGAPAGGSGWSPDGRSLATSLEHGGRFDIYLLPVEGGEGRWLTTGLVEARNPVWTSVTTIAYTADLDGAVEPRLLDVRDGTSRPIEAPPSLRSLRVDEVVSSPAGWLDTIVVRNAPAAVSPGQWLLLEGVALGGEGPFAGDGDVELRWQSSDSARVAPAGEGWFRVLDTGSVRLSVSVPGWRSTEVTVASRVLVEAPVPLLLEEEWKETDPRGWHAFGDPLPTTHRGSATEGPSYLASNGDGVGPSGVVSDASWPATDGLTIELLGRAWFNGAHWQDLELGFTRGPPPQGAGRDVWLPDYTLPFVSVSGRAGAVLGNIGPIRPGGLPILHDPTSWHRYALQLAADGTVSVVVDGRLVWRWTEPEWAVLDSTVRVLLQGRAVDADVRHGPVRVWRGERYVLR